LENKKAPAKPGRNSDQNHYIGMMGNQARKMLVTGQWPCGMTPVCVAMELNLDPYLLLGTETQGTGQP